MHQDISDILRAWPHEPGKVNVRLIEGADGEPRIQVRLDLGILQMNRDGRPDGRAFPDGPGVLEIVERRIDDLATPEDHSGGLGDDHITDPEVYEELLNLDGGADLPDEPEDEPTTGTHTGPSDTPSAENPTDNPAEPSEDPVANLSSGGSMLSSDDCRLLRDEAIQFHHRSVALLILDDFERTYRDASRNLRVLDLLAEHAEAPDDRGSLEALRPYLIMLSAQALACQAMKEDEGKAALLAIDEGLNELRAYYIEHGSPEAFENAAEPAKLRALREQLVPKLPVSQKAELRERLNAALAAENYELAAILRDELRLLPD